MRATIHGEAEKRIRADGRGEVREEARFRGDLELSLGPVEASFAVSWSGEAGAALLAEAVFTPADFARLEVEARWAARTGARSLVVVWGFSPVAD